MKLKGRPLTIFYKAIGIDPEGSTVKLIKIGQVSPRLKRHLGRLPNAWTTLYELAQLKSDEFETLLASDALHPLATWDDLKAALGRGDKRDHDHQRVSLPFRFNLSKLPTSRQRDFVERLIALCDEFKTWSSMEQHVLELARPCHSLKTADDCLGLDQVAETRRPELLT